MARRRMFSLDIIDTDLFLEMPQSSRLLYYELCMRADDDGFVSSPKKIQKMVGCSDDDFKVLITKKFIIPFDTGVVVIRHWKIHNYIQKDRYNGTIYKEEKSLLYIDETGAYNEEKGTEILEYKKESKPLTDAQRKRLEAKKESDLPYSFEYKIRNAFIGENCPICGCVMSYENELVKPTIQHNKPISLGGKHEINNISVICNSCNSSIQNRLETPPYNTELVKQKWECIRNVSGMDTQVRLGKVSIGKDNKEKIDKKEKEKKIHFADFVTMTNTEYEKLISTYGKEFTDYCISVLDNYKGSKGKTYKDDYRAILSWVVKRVKEDGVKPNPKKEELKEIDVDNMSDEEYAKIIKGEKYV